MATLTVLGGWDQGIRDLTGLEFATNLETLDLGENLETGINSNDISNLSPLSGLTNLWWISLSRNSISDISPLAGLTNLGILYLNDNSISDISPLVANTGLGSGDEVYLGNNPLSSTSINTHIPALESRGVTVHYEGGGAVEMITAIAHRRRRLWRWAVRGRGSSNPAAMSITSAWRSPRRGT